MSGSEKIYDVAIIGGGLAGLTLAIQCVDAGYKTILFEKENYPFLLLVVDVKNIKIDPNGKYSLKQI